MSPDLSRISSTKPSRASTPSRCLMDGRSSTTTFVIFTRLRRSTTSSRETTTITECHSCGLHSSHPSDHLKSGDPMGDFTLFQSPLRKSFPGADKASYTLSEGYILLRSLSLL